MAQSIRRFLFIITFFSAQQYCWSQPFMWANQIGGPGSDYIVELGQDAFGNVYTVGSFEDSIDLDPGPDIQLHYSAGNLDAYIQKLDPSGNLIWAISFGGENSDGARSIAFDSENNVYVSGYFQGTVDFNPSEAEIEERTSMGFTDAFIMKLTNEGELIWVQEYGNTRSESGSFVRIMNDDKIILSGFFNDEVDFDYGVGEHILSNADSSSKNIFCLKLESDGEFIWVKQLGTAGLANIPIAMELSSDNSIYIASDFEDSIDIDPGPEIQMIYNPDFCDNSFISKLDETGEFQWGYAIHGPGCERLKAMAIDNDGNIIVGGQHTLTSHFNQDEPAEFITSAGGEDIFLLKLNEEGGFIWLQHFGSENHDMMLGITVNPANQIIATGAFSDSVDFDFGPESSFLKVDTYRDSYVLKVTAEGTFLEAFSFPGSGFNLGTAILAPSTDYFYAAGLFSDTVDFNPYFGTSYLYEIPPGGHYQADGYLTKFGFGENHMSIASYENQQKVTLFPNPTESFITIKSDLNVLSVKIYNSLGQQVYLQKLQKDDLLINLTHLSSGLYSVVLELADGSIVCQKVEKF